MSGPTGRKRAGPTGQSSDPAAAKPAMSREEWLRVIREAVGPGGPQVVDMTDEAVEKGLAFVILGGRPVPQPGSAPGGRDRAERAEEAGRAQAVKRRRRTSRAARRPPER